MTQKKGDAAVNALTLDLSRPVPLVPLRDTLVVPGSSTRILVGRDWSMRALDAAREEDGFILLVLQRDSNAEDVKAEDLCQVGVLSRIQAVTPLPNGYLKVLVEGILTVNILEMITDGYFSAMVSPREFHFGDPVKDKDLAQESIRLFSRYAEIQDIPPGLIETLRTTEPPLQVFMGMIPFMRLASAEKQGLLEQDSLEALGNLVNSLLQTAIDTAGVSQRIRQDVQHKMQQSQKEWLINEQIRMLQEEISEGESGANEVTSLVNKIKAKHFSPAIQEKLDEELDRMKLMHPTSPEYAVVRNYLDWFLAFPYNQYTETSLNLKKVKAELDAKHFGLEKVKDRVLEYVAVLKLTGSEKHAPILCLVGPPGVGKTTLATSIAEAIGRNFVRITLGGVRDEAEIRGHRRTYIGSMPGRFIQALRRAKCMNPVVLLDEIDKMASDFRGDPASAMLEVLDPELNHDFADHFMEVGLDLSRVLFIATANSEEDIPAALHDRLEMVRLPGYYIHEKQSIAKEYLIPKVCERCGVANGKDVVIDDVCVHKIIREYTREAGVRELERLLETIIRKRAKEMVLGKKFKPMLTEKEVVHYLGVPRFLENRLSKPGRPGLVTGLAWTSVGGEILSLECTLLSGRGHLQLTGKLGDVMKESAQIALSLVRERLHKFGIDPAIVRKTDIHIHVPEGAVPKDGPSAGIGLTLSLLSAFTRIPVSPDIAFTGEVSLTGELHAIGGLNEKALAALDAGVKTLFLPQENGKDVVELPSLVHKGLKIHLKSHIDEIIHFLFPLPLKQKVSVPKQ
jgi:ATP-dependent Lon protease